MVFDVGQAAWAVVELAPHVIGIIDCGAASASYATRVCATLRDRLEDDSDMVIAFLLISHFDVDHCSGIATLLEDEVIRERIRCVVCNRLELRALLRYVRREVRPKSGVASHHRLGPTLRSLLLLQRFIDDRSSEIRSFHREVVAPSGSDPSRFPVRLKFPEIPEGVEIDLYAPSQRLIDRTMTRLGRSELAAPLAKVLGLDRSSRWNTASCVVAVSYAGSRVLFPGDADSETWDEIFGSIQAEGCESDAVVAAHHGARLGEKGGESFDRVVWRRVLRQGAAVAISHGCDNRYGHPHEDTVDAIRQCGAHVLCTQRKTALYSPDWEYVFDFETVGLALDLDPRGRNIEQGGRPPFRKREGSIPCCGDIQITQSDEGLKAEGTRFDWRERDKQPGCCQFES